jgi:hypothetical protein
MLVLPIIGAALYAIFIFFFGFANIFWLSLVIAAIMLFQSIMRRDWSLGLIKVSLFLALFDNSIITPEIASAPVRLSFISTPFLLVYAALKVRSTMKRGTVPVLVCVFLLSLLHIIFFFFSDKSGVLYGIKYLFFTFAPMGAISFLLARNGKLSEVAIFFVKTGIFIGIFSLIQLATIRSGNFMFQPHVIDLYPAAFFSERTWFGLYLAFCINFLFICLHQRRMKLFEFSACLALFVLGVLLSLSRNAFLALTIFVCCYPLLILPRENPERVRTLLWFLAFCLIAVLMLGLMSLALLDSASKNIFEVTLEAAATTINAFLDGNESGMGRLQAIEMTIGRYLQGEYSLLGNGFDWSYEKDITPIAGTAIGAKSANIFAFVLHIYGVLGLIIMIMLGFFLLRKAKRFQDKALSRLTLLSLLIWMVMAQFAPLHQYGISTTIFGILIGALITGRDAVFQYQIQ